MEEFDSAREVETMAGGDVSAPDVKEVPPMVDVVVKADPDDGTPSPPESVAKDVTSPQEEVPDSSFADDPPPEKEEVVEETPAPAVEEDDDDPVSSSTPVASKPTPGVEEVAESVEPVAALHLSGYFFSLEDRLPASMLDLVYWRQPAYTGAVFSALLLLLFSLSIFSAISVFAHVALLGLAATLSFVSFKKVAAAVQKTGEGHPFQEILDRESTALLPVDDVNGFVQDAVVHLFHAADLLRGLFLVANVFESLKFCVFLYAMTYVGEAFNLMTLVIIAAVSIFTIPKVYEVYGTEIDIAAEKLVAQAKAQWPVVKEQIVDRLMVIKEKAIAAIPIGKEKAS